MANKAVGFLTFNFGANLGGFNRAMKKAQRSVRKFGRSIKNMGPVDRDWETQGEE